MRNTNLSGFVLVAVAALAMMFTGGGCSAEGKLASRSAMSGGLWTVKLESPSFKNEEEIPEKYTQDGLNFSPPLTAKCECVSMIPAITNIPSASITFRPSSAFKLAPMA